MGVTEDLIILGLMLLDEIVGELYKIQEFMPAELIEKLSC